MGRLWGTDIERDRMRVQALRADRPGLVASGSQRKRVFGAALGQFDALHRASEALDSSASPILLYYALAQAGQAVAAARVPGRVWRPKTHGARVKSPSQVIGETTVVLDETEVGSFQLFCEAVGSAPISGPVSLAALWASVPQLSRVEGLGAGQAPGLAVSVVDSVPVRANLTGSLIADLPADDDAATAVLTERLHAYPRASDGLDIRERGTHSGPRPREYVVVSWRTAAGELRSIDDIAPRFLGSGGGHQLAPALSPARDVIDPAASIWLILLALSSVARYRPDLWRTALDRDATPAAVALEDGLNLLRELLPILVIWAITGEGWVTA